jgi:hypothetical protein
VLPFEEQLNHLLEHSSTQVYVAAGVLVVALLLWGVSHTSGDSRLPVEQRRKVKEEVVRMMRGEYQGLNCDGIAAKLGIVPRDLRPLLHDLVEDRFLLAEGEPGDPVYRLRGLDNF